MNIDWNKILSWNWRKNVFEIYPFYIYKCDALYFLNDKIFIEYHNIKINWFFYFDKNKLYYEDKPLQERIKVFRYADPVNNHIKSIVKVRLSINFHKKHIHVFYK